MPDNFGKYFVNAIVAGLLGRLSSVVKTELENAKAEISEKLKNIGIGVGLLAAAAGIGFFLVGVLIAAAILGLSTVWPAWLAALTVAGAMLLLILILGGVGASIIKKNKDLKPQQSIDNLKNLANI
ncbi:phage holin family protein [Demequina pelophila]|uniref:phage holin family protein n=1 Tax=Demequina pelophila TaxID=1638984 RepID=UPI00078319CD|nr:phage holin family protein [Demequina pelophila]